jgi:hypothetical protein
MHGAALPHLSSHIQKQVHLPAQDGCQCECACGAQVWCSWHIWIKVLHLLGITRQGRHHRAGCFLTVEDSQAMCMRKYGAVCLFVHILSVYN